MRRVLSRHGLKLAWICSLAGMALPQAYPQQLHEQLLFSAEDEGVKKPVSVPDDVLSLLAREEFVRSAAVDWGSEWSGRKLRRVALPGYAFQRERYWIEASAAPEQ